ncbi:PREDICTED: uncharacterized protein LOC105563600 [Vollenhovia emeryi]|uniref:uncharacterized protein LOC105563600 n=1 Tax=Vollenhovia emeryi TaxID=411798 RepID=UPI0005F3AC22|nr:PREDICTED: uncharacterized protein LOC105563600 [Vollenhovia emeryi]
MSSLILSHDSHLMMLEIAVENLFVPWTTAFDKVVLKETVVMFRVLDEDWISLSPNRRDYRPYQGSNYENEKFYGGRSVVFSVPADFFGEKASGVGIQLLVRKQVCKYFEMVSRQRIGSATVPVDSLLNSIAKQIRERDELAEHLSDFYKRQIISRSMMGTYTLLDENFRNTAATISLYIRISYLGKCLITEITQVKSIRGAFYTRGDSDEKQPYFSRQLTSKELQSGCWIDSGLPHVPHGRLICRCEELVKKEAVDLTRKAPADAIADSTVISISKDVVDVISAPKVVTNADVIKKGKTPAAAVTDSTVISVSKDVVDTAAIKTGKAPADAIADSTVISISKDVVDVVAIEREKALADAITDFPVISVPNDVADVTATPIAVDTVAVKQGKAHASAIANSAAISIVKVAENVPAVKEKELASAAVDSTAISVAKIAVNAAAIETRKAPANYGALGDRTDIGADVDALVNAYARTTIPIIATDNEVINDEQTYIGRKDQIQFLTKDVKADVAAIAKTKGHAIKDNGERAFKKAFSESSKSKRGRNTATIVHK